MQHTRCLDSLEHEVANGDISLNPTDGDFRLKIGDVDLQVPGPVRIPPIWECKLVPLPIRHIKI